MKLTAEISLYPLRDEHVGVIEEFIRRLRRHTDLTLVTNAMSTQVSGDYDRVFAVVAEELRASVSRHGDQVLVCKFLAKALDITNNPVIR